MRALPQKLEFATFLLNVGDGELNNTSDELNIEHFPKDCIVIYLEKRTI